MKFDIRKSINVFSVTRQNKTKLFLQLNRLIAPIHSFIEEIIEHPVKKMLHFTCAYLQLLRSNKGVKHFW